MLRPQSQRTTYNVLGRSGIPHSSLLSSGASQRGLEAGGPQRWAAELGLTRAASPAAAAAEAEAEGDAVYEARIKKLQCELLRVRLEAEEKAFPGRRLDEP